MSHDTSTQGSDITAQLQGAYGAPKIIYILYFVGFVFPLAALGGLVYAYISKGKDAGADTHLDFQIRTFWWGLLACFVGALLSIVLIGWLVIIAWIVWTLTRCITGLQLAGSNKPISGVGSFGFLAK